MIETKALSIARDGAEVLQGIDLSLPPEGITAIIGPNGAGKSTLLHAMARQGAKTGVASLCIGGGEAVAVLVERD